MVVVVSLSLHCPVCRYLDLCVLIFLLTHCTLYRTVYSVTCRVSTVQCTQCANYTVLYTLGTLRAHVPRVYTVHTADIVLFALLSEHFILQPAELIPQIL